MRVSLLASVLLSVSAVAGHAAGLNLSWDHCYSDGPAVSNKSFACAGNGGVESLCASFVLATPLTLQRQELVFDVVTRTGSQLPVWWDFATLSSCRLNQLAVDTQPLPDLSVCRSLAGPSAATLVLVRDDYRVPTPDRMQLAFTIGGTGKALEAGVEYYSCRILISHAHTVGSGACDGCMEPLAITFSGAAIRGSVTQLLSAPASNNMVNWQTTGPTAARLLTWGAVKALYR